MGFSFRVICRHLKTGVYLKRRTISNAGSNAIVPVDETQCVPVLLESADSCMSLRVLQLAEDLKDALDTELCKEDKDFLRRQVPPLQCTLSYCGWTKVWWVLWISYVLQTFLWRYPYKGNNS